MGYGPVVPALVTLTVVSLLLLARHVRDMSQEPLVVMRVSTDPYIFRLHRQLQEQKMLLDDLTMNPKIVFRCLDDEPKIKYPKQAGDDLTEIVMATNDECGNTRHLDAVIIVHTSADHFARRQMFRTAYSNHTVTAPYRLKVVFLIGHVLNANLQIELEQENRYHGDTVVGGFMDTYQNLTLKAVMGYRWLTQTCRHVPLLIKLDDDVLVDPIKLFAYWSKVNANKQTKTIFCNVWRRAVVGRVGKWKVERGLFANSSYPFPYCSGFFVMLTPDLIEPMYQAGKLIDFFWIDDVFLYGMVPAALKNVTFVHIGRKMKFIVEKFDDYDECLTKDGLKCPSWAVVTRNETEFKHTFSRLRKLYDLHPRLNSTNVTGGQT